MPAEQPAGQCGGQDWMWETTKRDGVQRQECTGPLGLPRSGEGVRVSSEHPGSEGVS